MNKTTTRKTLPNTFKLVILFLFSTFHHVVKVAAELTCHQCGGISCLRTTNEATQNCLNDLDICVNVFDGQTLLAQGCWEQLPEEFRYKCESDAKNQSSSISSARCFKCKDNLCNKKSSSLFQCIQCNSKNNKNCLMNPLGLPLSRCDISRTPNQYCFVKRDGEHVTRGCTYNLEEQMSCLSTADCMICQSGDLSACNNIDLKIDEGSTDGDEPEDLDERNGRICYQCRGINCLRTSYTATQKCLNNVDTCVTVFDGQTILAQGCWEQMADEIRSKCNDDSSHCLKCNENLCNNFASESFECLQCDSNNDENCRTNPLGLVSSRCNISRASNDYCYVKQEGDRVIRGCFYTPEEQILCLSSENCTICLPSEVHDCNNIGVLQEDNSGSDENSKNDSNEDASENNGTDNDSINSNGGNPDEIPSDGEGNKDNSDSSTESPNNNDESSGLSGCIRTSSLNILLLVNLVLLFVVKQYSSV